MATTSAGRVTVTDTDEAPLPNWSLTVSWKVSVAVPPTGMVGAGKLGVSVVALASVTGGPAIWIHDVVAPGPFGSRVLLPPSVTWVPETAVKLAPALTTGSAPLAEHTGAAGVRLPGQGSSCSTIGPAGE